MDVTKIMKYIIVMNIDRLIDFNLFQNVVFYGIHKKNIKKITVFKVYVSQLRISLVTTGSDAVKHLLLLFKPLSDEIGSRSHTCPGSIKIQNYVSEFLRKTDHLFFQSKKRRIFFISWAPDHYKLLKRG